MKLFKLAASCGAAFALASAGCAYNTTTPGSRGMIASSETMMSSCMSMSHPDMMKSASCAGMMKTMNMSESDLQTMMSCHKMTHADMTKDERCTPMMKMHADKMKGEMPK